MKRWLIGSLTLFTLACTGMSAPIPQGKLDDIARDVAKVGHPHGTYKASRFVGASSGGLLSNTGGRYLDVAIDYEVKAEAHTMTVRFHVEQYDPCKVRTEVLEDDGPYPILLDNFLAGPAVGAAVCDALVEEEAP